MSNLKLPENKRNDYSSKQFNTNSQDPTAYRKAVENLAKVKEYEATQDLKAVAVKGMKRTWVMKPKNFEGEIESAPQANKLANGRNIERASFGLIPKFNKKSKSK